MKSWFTIANFIGLFGLIIIILICYKEIDVCNEEYNELRLSKAVEYASEVAFSESVGGINNDTSYEASRYLSAVDASVNTDNTLQFFDLMMALNYGMALDKTSYTAIEDAIGTFVMMAGDGYYITNLQETGENETSLTWTPKLPYIVKTNKGTYSVTLNSEYWTRVKFDDSKGDTAKFRAKIDSGAKYSKTGGDLTEYKRRQGISQTLTDAIAYSVDTNSMYYDGSEYAAYIPSEQTMSGINSIRSASMMVIMRGNDWAKVEGPQKAALTGLKVIRKVRCIGYTDKKTGAKVYCHEYQGASNEYTVDDIDRYFDSEEEAAAAGYKPDYNYIFNGIDYDGYDSTLPEENSKYEDDDEMTDSSGETIE